MKLFWLCFMGLALLLPATVRSQDATAGADKPYASIIARNMFGLLPIPPPDTNPPAPPGPHPTAGSGPAIHDLPSTDHTNYHFDIAPEFLHVS